MYRVIYYILIFLFLGGIGMAAGSRKTTPAIRRQRWLKYFMYIGITGTIILGICYHFFFWLAGVIVMMSLVEIVKVNKAGRVEIKGWIFSILALLAIAAGFMLFAWTFTAPFLLFIYFQVLVFDGFCQVSGQLFGRHLLAPGISPTKTVEGLAGGWLFCIIAAALGTGWMQGINIYFGILWGLVTGFIAFWGDLLASFYKRKAGVKDYSAWLPGQGGFLDRFDSFLLSGAFYYLLYIIALKASFRGFIK